VYTIVVVIGSGFGAKGALLRTSPAATLEISRRKVVRMSAISGKRRLAAKQMKKLIEQQERLRGKGDFR